MKSHKRLALSHSLVIVALATLMGADTLRAQFAEDVLRFSTFNLGIGARSAAMGNTSIGIANDFSSLFTNPAGLTSLKSFEFSVGLSNAGYNNDATFLGTKTNSSERITNLNNFGLVYPVPTKRGSLSFAFGYARVANFSSTASFEGFNPSSSIVEALTPGTDFRRLSADDIKSLLDYNIPHNLGLAGKDSLGLFPLVTDSVQQDGTVRETGGINSWSFGGAVEIAKGLSLGVGVNIFSGSYGYDRLYTEIDSMNVYHYAAPFDFTKFRYESTINSDLSGYNVLIGLMYHKQGKYNLGLTVRTPTYYKISEDFADIGNSWFDNGDHFQTSNPGSTSYEVQTPLIISAGASAQATDWLLLAGDAEFTDWTQMEFTGNNADLMEENRVIRSMFRSTTNLRAGAEVTLFDLGLRLRGGFVYNPSPYKGDPTDFDQKYYTAGVGASIDENVSLNASVAFGTWKTFRDNYYLLGLDAPSRTSESVSTSLINITLAYRF
jgi:long-subunit fatty acid transport protein